MPIMCVGQSDTRRLDQQAKFIGFGRCYFDARGGRLREQQLRLVG
jgi:hypothetical protein